MVGSGADEGVRKMSLLPAFNEPMLWTFPCGLDKKPRTKHGFHDAVQGVRWRNYPLMGVPTGRRNDFDVLDIDGDAGLRWYEANYDAIPQTRAHSTQRGMHLLFRYAPGLHCSTGSKTSGIAPGIDVRTTGGYCIWWPREGYPIEDHPLSEWPEWLYEEARGKSRLEVYPNTLPSSLPHSLPPDAVVAELTKALFKLNPVEWRSEGSQESYNSWLWLMIACKAAGINREDWVEWCVGDENYADDGDEIGRKWDGVTASHSDALFKALAKGEIGLSREVTKWRSVGVHLSAKVAPELKRKPPPNLHSRSDGLLRWLSQNGTGDGLFSAACLFSEMGLTQATATKLISGNLPSLRKALGDAEFTRQIERASAYIAAKGAPPAPTPKGHAR
jgi:hypothetical protein